jgi:hypothetical protein
MSIPYKYLLYYSYTENLYFKMSISTFFFSFAYSKEEQKESTYIKVFSFKKEFEKKSSEKETEDKKLKDKIKEKVKKKSKKEKKKKKSGIPFSIIRYENIKHIFQLLIDLLKMIIPKHLRLYFLIGLEEPHLNGWLIASYYSLKGIYPKLPINIDIDWEKENYESNGELSGYIIPIQLVARILVFIFSVKTIKILWKVFKYKRSK